MLFALSVHAEAQQAKKIHRIGFLVNTGTPYSEAFYQRLREFANAYAAMTKERADGLIIFHGSVTLRHRKMLLELASKNRLPTMCGLALWAEEGGLISYGVDDGERWRRAAVFVDKILKGAKPADLPVEQPTKFEFVINLKTAKQIGVTIPQSVLFRASKVIK